MFNWIRQQVLHFMRVPHDPEPPFGAPGSIRVFRAGRNYYKLRLFRWTLGQVGALVGIGFSLAFFCWFKGAVEAAMIVRAAAAKTIATAPAQPPSPPSPVTSAPAPSASNRKVPKSKRDPRQDLQRLAARTPWWVILIIEVLEIGGILLFLVQLPVTFAAVRLDFEMHWYIVTDRSLRIRTGLLRLQESTMSFANLQQVEVKQGPLQRLLGLADVHVQSAGGGGDRPGQPAGDQLHTGIFHSVNNATEIRDLILERLRRFRQAGLGDPDDHAHHPAPVATAAVGIDGDALAAARDVLAEARALRAALS